MEEFRKILRLEEYDSNNSNTRNTLLSNRGSALIDPATNTLIVTDNRGVIEKFRKLIDELDVPTRQVMGGSAYCGSRRYLLPQLGR